MTLTGTITVTVALAASPADPEKKDEPKKEEKADDKKDKKDEKKEDEKKEGSIKPYEKVITKEAKSSSGVFAVHRIDEKLYFEIPTNRLGKEFLWVSQIEKTDAGFGYGGGTPVNDRVVRWELRDKDILLRDVHYAIRADVTDSIRHAVESTSLEPIIRKFPVLAWGTNHEAVIEVTDFFTTDVPEFSAKKRLNATGVDKGRSFIEKVKAFPENIETKVTLTYTLNTDNAAGRSDPSQSAVSVLLHHSMVKLPDVPMRPRVEDSRVGFFNVAFEDYGLSDQRVKQVRYITRWRLEKKDPDAAVSEPKKPIVFYLGRGVPDKWRPWVKKGIEAWQPAFLAAGFKNAIIAKDAPSVEEDPDWDAEDARYSTIMWLPSTIENAMGPHVHDPRSGEVLEADILMYHNSLKLARDWYFTQASPMDSRAQKLPLPDDLMGELLAYIVTHEVGHTLGFPHNMKASSSYTIEQLRSPDFTGKFGNEASIMDYGRFNYVSQPGDKARLIPIVGPYDFFAVAWGYTEFKGATNAAQEKVMLDTMIARQITDPTLRFGNANPDEDPSAQTEDLGSDPVKATELGLKNINRVADFLVKATCGENEDYDLLRNMYDHLMRQRDQELNHVVGVVGGVVYNNIWYGQGDRQYEPIPGARQREAVAFLMQNGFQTPTNLLDRAILARLESTGGADRVLASQRRLLNRLVNDRRVKRMAELAIHAQGAPYLPADLLTDLRAGIWSELRAGVVEIDLYRRDLQRAHTELLINQLNRDEASSDLPALARGELKSILTAVRSAESKARDRSTYLHLQDLAYRIDHALDPKPRGYWSRPVG
ncbi:MAG TPA: zinc-dependent metalloprotease [Verrucomicrobiae bacterium]|nr:zinc-dependent metalloprotease [Verrucomicrobiae bacterium]